MTIDDIKRLWGLSAGRCAYPGCNLDCIQFFKQDDPTIIGEMAHVIARSEKGPRGKPGGGANTYDNLILLCPTHHTTVDKAPAGTFPEEMLFQWKRDHEAAVKETLIDNYEAWRNYGPESSEAMRNELPDEIASLAPRQAWFVRDVGWKADKRLRNASFVAFVSVIAIVSTLSALRQKFSDQSDSAITELSPSSTASLRSITTPTPIQSTPPTLLAYTQSTRTASTGYYYSPRPRPNAKAPSESASKTVREIEAINGLSVEPKPRVSAPKRAGEIGAINGLGSVEPRL